MTEFFVQNFDQEVAPESAPESAQEIAYLYQCRLCKKIFSSRRDYDAHFQMDTECKMCTLHFETCHKMHAHRHFCAYSSGRINIARRPFVLSQRVSRPVVVAHKCTLCEKKFRTKGFLYAHLVHMCKKRFISVGWVVKI